MLIRNHKTCRVITAGDHSDLREFYNPIIDDIGIGYSLAEAVLKAGKASKLHILKASEVYYILEGSGKMYIDDEVKNISAGQAIYVPPNGKQYVKNTGKVDLRFLCIVDPAWKKEDEVIL